MNSLKEYLWRIFKPSFQLFSSIVNPKTCYACNRNKISGNNIYLCNHCLIQLPYTDHFERNYINSVHEKFYGRFNIVFGAALFYFYPKGIVGGLIHNYKYNRKKYLGYFLAELICEKLDTCMFLPKFDIITCIPLHENKLISRGFNQSSIIADEIGKHLHIDVDNHILIKLIETSSQTRKNRKERLLNISNSIAIDSERLHLIKGKDILIIDDTLTTGATIESCGKILLKNGARNISVLCITQAI